jgi:pimeloyl-ACP methyl ester carboxylesterase
MIRNYRFLWTGISLLVGVALLPACTLLNLREESKLLQQVTEISGTIEGQTAPGKPIVVVLLAIDPAKPDRPDAVMARTILLKPGNFKFFAGSGIYRVSAFVDLNENASYQINEPAGWHDEPKLLRLADGQRIADVRVVLRSSEQVKSLYPEVGDPTITEVTDYSNRFKTGAITSLDNQKFSQENGVMSFWEPLRFLGLDIAGLYFLENYDPRKTPVLFIHGAGGNPGEWRLIIEKLDRQRFQPWVLFYPSGLRLDVNRQWVSNALAKLQQQYQPTRIHIVAHSMGGLLAGGIVTRLEESGHGDLLGTLVTLSTPWGGHELAATGVSNSPAVVPAWFDMVPGSRYQQLIFAAPWPKHLTYHLIFSHRGGYNVMSGGNTDGVVSFDSQLSSPAQERAASIRGFAEDHTSILASEAVAARLATVLAAK